MEYKFLSWNINRVGNSNQPLINRIISYERPDFLLIIECDILDSFFISLGYTRIENRSNELKFFSLNKHTTNIGYHTIGKRAIHVQFNTLTSKVLFTGVHLNDKYHNSEHAQYVDSLSHKIEFEGFKKAYNCESHILFGDFNMNPFDKGLACKSSIHAKPTHSTKYQLPYYYNPSWSLLGDFGYNSGNNKPPGTYKFSSYKAGDHLWNVLDGVIISSNLAENKSFVNKSLRIIDDSAIYSNHQIKFSDHLPISFNIILL